jgi:hypothetical protein
VTNLEGVYFLRGKILKGAATRGRWDSAFQALDDNGALKKGASIATVGTILLALAKHLAARRPGESTMTMAYLIPVLTTLKKNQLFGATTHTILAEGISLNWQPGCIQDFAGKLGFAGSPPEMQVNKVL